MFNNDNNNPDNTGSKYTAFVITVSDRAYNGIYEDKSGPAVSSLLSDEGFEICGTAVVPDEKDKIIAAIRSAMADSTTLIITSGGTGPAARDVTPEASSEVIERFLPGIPEAMRAASLKVTSHAALSREVAGIARESVIINVPGSPKAAVENLSAVLAAVRHCIDIIHGMPS